MRRTRKRQFGTAFLAVLLGALGLVALVNTLIDPYGNQGFLPSLDKHKAGLGSMSSKVALASRGDYNVLFIGSSRTGVGLDPESRALAPSARAFNFGLSGCGLVEMEAALAFGLRKNPGVKAVLIDLEPSYFSALFEPSPDYARSLLNPATSRFDHALGMAVGFETIELSIRTLRDARAKSPPADTLRGLMLPQFRLPLDYTARRAFLNHFAPQAAAARVARSAYLPDRIAYVERMLELCRERGVEATLFVAPVHASRLLWAMSMPNHEGVAQLKRDLVAAAARARARGASVKVVDFSLPRGPNVEAIPTSVRPGERMSHYIDPVHFLPSVGDLVLRETLPAELLAPGDLSEPLGVALDESTLEPTLALQGELLSDYEKKLRAEDAEFCGKLLSRGTER